MSVFARISELLPFPVISEIRRDWLRQGFQRDHRHVFLRSHVPTGQAVIVAIVNYCMVYVDVKLVTWKFDLM